MTKPKNKKVVKAWAIVNGRGKIFCEHYSKHHGVFKRRMDANIYRKICASPNVFKVIPITITLPKQ